MFRRAVDKEANGHMERHVRRSATQRETKVGYWKNRSLTTQEDCAVFTSLIQQMRKTKETVENCAKKVGSSDASSNASQDQGEKSTRKLVALLMFARQNLDASLKPTNLRRKRVEGTPHEDHEDHIARKGIHWTITILCTSLFLFLSNENTRGERLQWKEKEKTRENTSMAAGQESGVPKAGLQQAAADSRVCEHPCCGWHMQERKGELTSCRGSV